MPKRDELRQLIAEMQNDLTLPSELELDEIIQLSLEVAKEEGVMK